MGQLTQELKEAGGTWDQATEGGSPREALMRALEYAYAAGKVDQGLGINGRHTLQSFAKVVDRIYEVEGGAVLASMFGIPEDKSTSKPRPQFQILQGGKV